MKHAARNTSRRWLVVSSIFLLLAILVYAFIPKPVKVDVGEVQRTAMQVTIDEEGRTRVRDAYLVSAPIAGRLLRVEVEPGDAVSSGETIIARMLANPPSAIDVRTREQARAGVDAAQAALRLARAELNRSMADEDFANAEVTRIRALRAAGTVSETTFDQAVRSKRTADAAVDTAKAAISMREAELANARARLIGFEQALNANNDRELINPTIPLRAPISGQILRVLHKSETTLAAGEPILEIGDVSNDLEIVAELLSTDAVQIKPGNKVIVDNWGGTHLLHGLIERVEPWGFTKFSALGVEEQRVNTIIRFDDPIESRASLGHGYRVEVRIVIWERDSILTVPSSALFRYRDSWSVFRIVDGRARIKDVEIGHNNGHVAELEAGLEEGEKIVLYPGPDLLDGIRVHVP